MEMQGIIQYGFITVICTYTVRAIVNILLVNRTLSQGFRAIKRADEITTRAQAQAFVQKLHGAMGRAFARYVFILEHGDRMLYPWEYFTEVVGEDVRNEWTGQRNRLILLGLLGTFVGLSYAVYNIAIETGDVVRTIDSIQAAQQGMKTAFLTSIFGIVGALIVGLFNDFSLKRDHRLVENIEDLCVFRLIPLYALNAPADADDKSHAQNHDSDSTEGSRT